MSYLSFLSVFFISCLGDAIYANKDVYNVVTVGQAMYARLLTLLA